jgi:threonine/homoserine/homoserine lactone efflux protein
LADDNPLFDPWIEKTLATIFGNISSLFLMSVLSVLELSTIILQSTTMLLAVKFVGAIYLIYTGIQLWRHSFRGVLVVASPEALKINYLVPGLTIFTA